MASPSGEGRAAGEPIPLDLIYGCVNSLFCYLYRPTRIHPGEGCINNKRATQWLFLFDGISFREGRASGEPIPLDTLKTVLPFWINNSLILFQLKLILLLSFRKFPK